MTPEEQTRLDEVSAAFSDPANIALLNQLVDGFNHLYDPVGLNMIIQVTSKEDASGRSWEALIEDNYSFPGKVIQAKVLPDKTIVEPVLLQP